jgi:hypothetical protein
MTTNDHFLLTHIQNKQKYIQMGVCGIVLTAIGSTLTQLAANCGTTALKVSTVFLARGAGAIFGSLISAKLFCWFHGNYVLVTALVWLAIVMLCLPFCDRVWYLHCLFAALGFGTAVTDTGCQIMTRKAHGKNAGPWLGANTVSFGIAGAIVPLMEIWTTNLITQFSILSSMSLLIAFGLVLIPVPTYLSQSMDQKLSKRAKLTKPSSSSASSTSSSSQSSSSSTRLRSGGGGSETTAATTTPVATGTTSLDEDNNDNNGGSNNELRTASAMEEGSSTTTSGSTSTSYRSESSQQPEEGGEEGAAAVADDGNGEDSSDSVIVEAGGGGVGGDSCARSVKRLPGKAGRCLWAYGAEQTLGAAVFCLIGGKVTFSSYIKLYVGSTGVIAKNHESLSLAVLWISITIGRLGGLWDQVSNGSSPNQSNF